MRDLDALTIPSIGRMREHVVICDNRIMPSPDDTLEIIRRRNPLAQVKASITQVDKTRLADYRPDARQRRDETEFVVLFRSIPNLHITTGDFVFWPMRKTNFQLDRWLCIEGIDMRLQEWRYTALECRTHTIQGPAIELRDIPQPQPIRGQERLY